MLCLIPTISKCPPIPTRLVVSQNLDSSFSILLKFSPITSSRFSFGMNWVRIGFPMILTGLSPQFLKSVFNCSGVKARNSNSPFAMLVLRNSDSLSKDFCDESVDYGVFVVNGNDNRRVWSDNPCEFHYCFFCI